MGADKICLQYKKRKPPMRAASVKTNFMSYFRRRKINSAAAPKPAKANVLGSGTGMTLNPEKLVMKKSAGGAADEAGTVYANGIETPE